MLRRTLLWAGLLFTNSFIIGTSALATPAPTELPTLAPTVKLVSPAVVNIATKGTVSERAAPNPFMDDPFLRRFFQMPDQSPRARPVQAAGSGVVVDSQQGLILTNAHVIEHASEITVTTQDGHVYKGSVVGSDQDSDIAVIKVKDAKLTAVAFGDSSKAEVGDYVLAIGNPFGLSHSVTFGIISALGRSGINPQGYEDFIQTDASINPGNSGGALVNLKGELIGINAAILSQSGGNIGIGFAIPSNMAKSVMDQIVRYGQVKHGLLGVTVQAMTPDVADMLGDKTLSGALVSQVSDGSAAAKAGIKPGDVITAINGVAIKNSADLHNRIGLTRAGDSVDITLIRDDKTMHLKATIGSKGKDTDNDEGAVGDTTALHPMLEGADLGNAPNGGVLIRSIEPQSPASATPLRSNDVIMSVNRQSVTNLAEFKKLIHQKATLLLGVKRGSENIVVVLQAR